MGGSSKNDRKGRAARIHDKLPVSNSPGEMMVRRFTIKGKKKTHRGQAKKGVSRAGVYEGEELEGVKHHVQHQQYLVEWQNSTTPVGSRGLGCCTRKEVVA